MSKESTPLKIIRSLFHAEISKGHLKWSVADLSRRNNISRATIYYYFGKSKKEIMTNALKAICDEYYGFTPERLLLNKKDFTESLKLTRELFLRTPEFVAFYHIWRFRDSEYKKLLAEYEKRYINKLIEHFNLDRDEALGLFTLLHGLITAPFLSPSEFAAQSKRLLIRK